MAQTLLLLLLLYARGSFITSICTGRAVLDRNSVHTGFGNMALTNTNVSHKFLISQFINKQIKPELGTKA